MGKLGFCEKFVHLDRQLISFAGRPYLPAVYASTERNLVLRCSRQTEKSTFLVNTILCEACRQPGIQILFVCPRDEQGRVFIRTRLLPAIEQSPILRRVLLGKSGRRPQVKNLEFANGSQLFMRAAYHSGDSSRGISASLLLVDEFQDVAGGDLPVLQETLSHAKHGRTILTGTPKSVDNHLDAMFRESTAQEWNLQCVCGKTVILDERSLAPQGIQCPGCHANLDPRSGHWIPRNPGSKWGDGFWICHPMVPWLNIDEILERQRTYDPARFKNEVMGLPTTLGEHMVTHAEMEACCGKLPMAFSLAEIPHEARGRLIAGIDWGGGGTSRTVLVIGFMRSDFVFQILRLEKFVGSEEPDRILRKIANRCETFQVQWIAADGGGNGHVYNRLLLDQLHYQSKLVAVLYSGSGQRPVQDGSLIKWTVGRSATIGAVFSRIKKQMILFPKVAECSSFLDEFTCEIAEYDDQQRTLRFTHSESQQDDTLHATNYAVQLGIYQTNHEIS